MDDFLFTKITAFYWPVFCCIWPGSVSNSWFYSSVRETFRNNFYSASSMEVEYCDDRVGLSLCLYYNYNSDLYQILCLLHVAVAKSTSGSIAICHLLQVLWIMS